MVRSTRSWRTALAAMALVVVVLPQPAHAHAVVQQGWPPGQRSGMIGGIQGFCVFAAVTQEHSWHSVGTWATNCQNNRNAWHAQYQEYYKADINGGPAQYCFKEGWHQSPNSQAVYNNFYGWDIWTWCNNGINVNVKLLVDSWQYSWSDNNGWIGGWWRPATMHCHCP